MTMTDPTRKEVYLTSILKHMDVTTLSVIEEVKSGNFSGGVIVGTLENNGVGLAPYHSLANVVSSDLSAEIEEIRKAIISGSIVMNK